MPKEVMAEKDRYARKWFRMNKSWSVEDVNERLKKAFGTGMDRARLKLIKDRKNPKDYRRPKQASREVEIAVDHLSGTAADTVEFQELEVEVKPHLNDIMKQFIRQELKKLLREMLSKI